MNRRNSVFFEKSRDRKNFDKKDERFPLLLKNTASPLFTAYCEFSNAICRDIEPYMTLFQAERPLAVFMYQKLVELLMSLLERAVKPQILNRNKSGFKLQKLVTEGMRKKADKSNPTKKLYQEDHLLPIESVDVGFAAKDILKKLKTKDKPEVTSSDMMYMNSSSGLPKRLLKDLLSSIITPAPSLLCRL